MIAPVFDPKWHAHLSPAVEDLTAAVMAAVVSREKHRRVQTYRKSSGRPTEGILERRRRVWGMRHERMGREAIADKLGLTFSQVRNDLAWWQRKM